MEADPNVRDQYSMTPIFVAVGCDHPEIIHPLLDEKWADGNPKDILMYQQ